MHCCLLIQAFCYFKLFVKRTSVARTCLIIFPKCQFSFSGRGHFMERERQFLFSCSMYFKLHYMYCCSIRHFRVVVNLTMKARLSAKLLTGKLVLFAYE